MVQNRKMKWIAATCAVGVCSLALADLADAQRRGGGGGGGARAGAARGAAVGAGGGGTRQVRSNARPSINQSGDRPGGNGGGIHNNGGNNIHGGNGNNSGNTININNSHNYVDNGYHDNGWGHDYDHYDDHWHPIATAAAVTATAIVIGSIVHSIPPSCVNVVMPAGTYYQCGSSWYQPQYVGTSVQYVVVAAPR